jgi:hypothetical protein
LIESHNSEKNLYICIPDTRFKNERDKIKNAFTSDDELPYKGIFVRVIRTNEDGSQYIDQSRDPNHPSEAELDGIKADFTLTAKGGDLESLKQQTINFLNEIDDKL